MQPSTIVCGLPFYKNLRDGQRKVVEEAILNQSRNKLIVQLPTGYGKTFTGLGVFRGLEATGRVNRCLYLVPRDRLLSQIIDDGVSELVATGYEGPRCIKDVSFHGVDCIRAHRMNKCAVFATTIQSLQSGRYVPALVQDLLSQGSWLIVVDEYQFYGEDNKWGPCVNQLNRQFLLAMSATPYRQNNDSAFGLPDIAISYRQAVKERAVKELELHSYVYRIDAVTKDGCIKTFTTDELISEAGDDSPEAIDRMRLQRNMRWSPKYVSPLISEPIVRMERQRLVTGRKLQAIVFAMSCSHAELVCDQLKSMHPHLQIDWVGTGEHGRSDDTNKKILDAFCPAKKDGIRHESEIKLDVLVNVGLAGIGLDCNYVSEVIFPRSSNKNQSWCQAVGRGSRFLSDDIKTFVSVDSSSPWASCAGGIINDAIDDFSIDGLTPEELDELKRKEEEDWLSNYELLPENPKIHIHDMECIRIDKGSHDVMAEVAKQIFKEFSVKDKSSPEVQKVAEELFLKMRRDEAEKYNAKAIVMQWDEKVEQALSRLTGTCVKLTKRAGARFDKTLPGDIKKRINGRKKRDLGPKANDVATLRAHYDWLRHLEKTIIEQGMPSWLV